MKAEQFTVRLATAEDDPAISALVVDGFLDKFRPIFGSRVDRALRIMERWVTLEHASGGVTSLVTEGYSSSEIAGSVGVRTSPSHEDILARGLWRALNRNLGLPRTLWATTLLSYPRYSYDASEAYVERLVGSPALPRPRAPPLAAPPPLFPPLLLRRLRGLRRAAGGLPRLPAPGHRQAPAGRRRRPRPRVRQGDRRPPRQRPARKGVGEGKGGG